jgi:hypothetical protein
MAEIQACPVCHIFIHLDKNERILNPCSDNYPEAPQAPQRTERYHTAARDIRLDKKNYILAKDTPLPRSSPLFPAHARWVWGWEYRREEWCVWDVCGMYVNLLTRVRLEKMMALNIP